MAWVALEQRGNLPSILAGPVLRRVEPDSVSVWLALASSANVTLRVYDGNSVNLLFEGTRSPIQIGPQLYIVTVTASPPGQQVLQPGQVYTYDVFFGGSSLGASPTIDNFVYGSFTLPSFVLPGAARNDLVLCQASCRKPHGCGDDALPAIDRLLEIHSDSPAQRPQLLLLTGDQIYADDVADALLHMIRDAANFLIAKEEILPGWGPISQLPPGGRAAVADWQLASPQGSPAFFSAGMIDKPEIAKSHLLAFSEYVLMYVFAWSDVLWQEDGGTAVLPTFEQAVGGTPTLAMKYDAEDGLVEEELPSPAKSCYENEVEALESFFNTLPIVRRMLANLPTYMMFDDHEITDDWYINAKWCQRALGDAAGRQVLANGLAAFALCQAWGNTPDLFEGGNGADFLTLVHDAGPLSNTPDPGQLSTYLLPPAAAILDSEVSIAQPPKRIRWDFDIVFDAFHLIVLDTRTRRQFPDATSTDFAHLIAPTELAVQVVSFQKDLIVIGFPPPLIGPPGIDEYQATRTDDDSRIAHDCESPVLQPAFFQRVLAEFAKKAASENGVRRASIVVFSGDVHYSMGARLSYASARALEEGAQSVPTEYVLVQLTASAAKNAVGGILSWGLMIGGMPESLFLGIPMPGRGLPDSEEFHGYRDQATLEAAAQQALNQLSRQHKLRREFDAYRTSEGARRRLLPTTGVLLDVAELEAPDPATLPFDWTYRIDFLQDERDSRPGSPLSRRELVETTNAGVVSFSGNDVVFDIWWNSDEDELYPATQITASLT